MTTLNNGDAADAARAGASLREVEPASAVSSQAAIPIAELERRHRDAIAARATLDLEKQRKRGEMMDEAEKRIRETLAAEYDVRLAELGRAETVARVALEDARIAAAAPRFPVGTVLVEWDNVRESRWSSKREFKPTGRRGVIEVATRDAQFAGNALYGRPSPGDVFVRILKADGKPGLKWEKFECTWGSEWRPEEASGIAARSAETSEATARPEGQEPGPEGETPHD